MPGYLMELGYAGFEVSSLPAWRDFATGVLGMQVHPGPRPGIELLRLDGQSSRFILMESEADDIGFAGWKVADAPTLDAYARHLDGLGVAYAWGTDEELALRDVERMLHMRDPNGVRHEAYVGERAAADAFVPGCVASGYVTRPGGLGHLVFGANAYAESIGFAKSVLGAAVSDTITEEIMPGRMLDVTFMHVNQRHHSIAFADMAGPKKLHHFMLEVGEVADVGRARDRHMKAGLPIVQDIGQHPNDRMISYYGGVPSGFLLEFGWGGVQVDTANWVEGHYDRISDWGHRPLKV